MSLYRSMNRGSWIVERTLLGVHIRRATGCNDLSSRPSRRIRDTSSGLLSRWASAARRCGGG